MRDGLQPQDRAQIREIAQELLHPAVVGGEELTQDEHGQQLRLGEEVFGLRSGVRRHAGLSGPQGFAGDGEGRLGQVAGGLGHGRSSEWPPTYLFSACPSSRLR